MIKEILAMLGGRLSTGPDWVALQDGDTLCVTIIRHGEPMVLLNLPHYGVDDEGHNVKVEPILIQITIETIERRLDDIARRAGRNGER
jgi:hypothetical protein